MLASFLIPLVLAAGPAGLPARFDPDTVLAHLTAARAVVHPERGEIVIHLAPVDLPVSGGGEGEGGGAHHDRHEHGRFPPVALIELPADGSLYGFRAEVIDALGRELPAALIHHVNVIDPDNRELFLPIARRLAAAGRETGDVTLPRLLFGIPFARGQRIVVNAMLHNPLDVSYRDVRVRVVLLYTPARRPWPLYRGAPFQLDVAFPVGDKSFDLPPGRSERSYEASPAIAGTIVAIGGHLHDYGVSIELANASTGEVIWRAEPQRDAEGRLQSIPVGRLYKLGRLGVHVDPGERYRVTVVYDNPTGRTLPAGGMGVVGGLFVPDDPAQWPRVNPTDTLYITDLLHATRQLGASTMAHSGH